MSCLCPPLLKAAHGLCLACFWLSLHPAYGQELAAVHLTQVQQGELPSQFWFPQDRPAIDDVTDSMNGYVSHFSNSQSSLQRQRSCRSDGRFSFGRHRVLVRIGRSPAAARVGAKCKLPKQSAQHWDRDYQLPSSLSAFSRAWIRDTQRIVSIRGRGRRWPHRLRWFGWR